jgi:hypothetical protein
MSGVELLQRFGFRPRNVDAGNSLRENVPTNSNRAERGKLLKGKLHHLRSKFEGPTSNETSALGCHPEQSEGSLLFSPLPKALIRDASLRST